MNGKEYLAANPLSDVIHSTSDGQLFYNQSDAQNHANTLVDKTVETFNQEKKMVEAETKVDTALLAATGEKVEEPKVEEPKVEEPKGEEVKVAEPAKPVKPAIPAKAAKPTTK
jgi:outer membrane biosynthesis protein TonB